MRNKIIIGFLFSLILISFNNVQAYGDIYPGGILNPLKIQIVPQTGDRLDALIQQQNQNRIYQQQVQQNQLLQQQINLQKSQLLQQQINSQPIPKSNDQICQDKYGLNNVWNGTKNNQGGLNCGCKEGYQWNEQGTSCVLDYNKICSDKFGSGFIWYGTINSGGGPDCSSKEENNQICGKDFGVNSVWSGKLNDKGGLVCDCNNGYQWNDTKTSCVIKTVQIKNVINKSDCNNGYSKNAENKCVENNQLCKNDFGENSKWGGKMNNKNGPVCDCNIGYYWNKEGTECLVVIQTEKNTSDTTEVGLTNLDNQIVATKEIVKHKSLWVKIKGLFGF